MRETIKSLPPGDKHPHGTRARYVGAKCRCSECRAANTAYYHSKKKKDAALLISMNLPKSTEVQEQVWTTAKGEKKVRTYRKACPGVLGEPCPNKSHLRKDSIGGVCFPCGRKLTYNGMVPAGPTRMHLKKLSARGIGYRTVAEASSMGSSILALVLRGDRKQVRASTERAVLAVTTCSRKGGVKVSAKGSWGLINYMMKNGLSRSNIASRLGSTAKRPALQIRKDTITLTTKRKISEIYSAFLIEKKEAMQQQKAAVRQQKRASQQQKKDALRQQRADAKACAREKKELNRRLKEDGKICKKCYYSHSREVLLDRLRSVLPSSEAELLSWWPCTYTTAKFLRLDLQAIRAEEWNGQWIVSKK